MKTIITLLLILFFFNVDAQSLCKPAVVNLAFSFERPVRINQVVGFVNGCDEDLNTNFHWSIIQASSPNTWGIIKNPNDPKGALIIVRDANRINKQRKDYYITVIVKDNTGLKSNKCIIKLTGK